MADAGAAAPTEAVCVDHADAAAEGTCTRCGGFLCSTCVLGGLCAACAARPVEPRAIGGWLILPMLGLFGYPLRAIAEVVAVTAEVTKAGGVGAVLAADPGWLALSTVDTVAALGLGAWSLFVMPGFFRKRRSTPRRMQVLFGAVLLVNAYGLIAQALQATDLTTSPVSRGAWAIVLPIVWVQYFRTSKRVKETFVR